MKRMITVIGLALLAGCQPGLMLPSAAPSPTVPEAIRQNLQQSYPQQFTATQRILVNVRGRQYDFLGVLRANADTLRALALGDLGGKVLDLRISGADAQLLENPGRIPRKPLLDGVAGDIRFIFGAKQLSGLYTAQAAEDTVHLVWPREQECWSEFLVSAESGRLLKAVSYTSGKAVREVAYRNYQKYGEYELPGRIVVHNRRWSYSQEIRLLKFEAGTK